MKGSFLFFIESCLKIGQAVFLSFLLDYFSQENPNGRDGYLYALGLSLTALSSALLHHVDFFFVSYLLMNSTSVHARWNANASSFHRVHLQENDATLSCSVAFPWRRHQYGF